MTCMLHQKKRTRSNEISCRLVGHKVLHSSNWHFLLRRQLIQHASKRGYASVENLFQAILARLVILTCRSIHEWVLPYHDVAWNQPVRRVTEAVPGSKLLCIHKRVVKVRLTSPTSPTWTTSCGGEPCWISDSRQWQHVNSRVEITPEMANELCLRQSYVNW
jgi:hypothetical protein